MHHEHDEDEKGGGGGMAVLRVCSRMGTFLFLSKYLHTVSWKQHQTAAHEKLTQ